MKKIESGRSMVEMLGVLALIGVLSITGIYGYTIAMRKYRANEIVQTASILAIVAHSKDQGRGGCVQLSTSNLPKTPGGSNVEIVADASVSGAPIAVHVHLSKEDAALQDFISVGDNSSYTIDFDITQDCSE